MAKLPPAAVAALSLLLAGAAAAEPVTTFRFAPRSEPSMDPRPQTRGGVSAATAATPRNRGVPGYYDPATRTFTAAPTRAAADEDGISGTFGFPIRIEAEYGVGPDDTVYCDLTIEFGNKGDRYDIFINHTVRKSINFAAGEPVINEALPFRYTPNGAGEAVMRVSVECRIPSPSAGGARSGSHYRYIGDIRPGTYIQPPFVMEM